MRTDVGFVLFIVPLKAHTMRVVARSFSNKHDGKGSPLRSEEERAALIEAVRHGTIDVIATDRATEPKT